MLTIIRKNFRWLLIIVVCFIGWRMVVIGLGEYYMRAADKGLEKDKFKSVDLALDWNPNHPKALFYKATPKLPDTH